MWNNNRISKLLGIKYPIIQGPFGGRFSSAKLVSAVSSGGGLGSFGLNSYEPEEILLINEEIKSLTDKPYNLNLWVPLKDDPAANYGVKDFELLKERFSFLFQKFNVPVSEMPVQHNKKFELQVEALLKAEPPVMSFIFGVPSKNIIKEFKKRGTILIATATNVEEAQLIEEVGIDLVVASGSEAGGHRGSFLKPAKASLVDTHTLLSEIVEKVKIPVIAAGGIRDGIGIFNAFKKGASAVQIGTAFLATDESNASKIHKERLFEGKKETILTKVYTGRPGRMILNDFNNDYLDLDDKNFAPYPFQSSFLSSVFKAAQEQGDHEYIAYWSGQSSVDLKYKSAGALLKALVEEVEICFSNTK